MADVAPGAEARKRSLDAWKARISIVAVVGRYVQLRQHGHEHKALCPFHDEKTPSFTVSEAKGFYHCFGCGQHGTAIDFVMAVEACDFRQALDIIGGITGIDPPGKTTGKRPSQGSRPSQSRPNGELEAAPPSKAKAPKVEIVSPVPDDAPHPMDHLAGVGRAEGLWEYRDAEGRLCFVVARFQTPAGKTIRPQVLVRRGRKLVWEWKAHPAPRPMLGLPHLVKHPAQPVLVVEGETCADAAIRHLGHRYAVTTWAGGSKAVAHTDWSPLEGREVMIWPDADAAGHAAADEILEQMDPADRASIRILPKLQGVPKGWDIVDALRAWPLPWIEDYLSGSLPEAEAPPEPSSVLPLGTVGADGDRYAYWSERAQAVLIKSASQLLQETHLLSLMPLDELAEVFPASDDRRPYSATAAREHLIGKASSAGQFDSRSQVRGRGVWRSGNGAILNTGAQLRNGARTLLLGMHDGCAYVRGTALDREAPLAHMTDREAQGLVDLCDSLLWSEKIEGKLLAGWLALAPLAGWLRWRPSIFLTGRAGAGKTTVVDRIARKMLGPWAISVVGDTSSAGIRQTLGYDARPVIFDEAESDTQQAQDRFGRILDLVRAASSDSGDVLKGSVDHVAVRFPLRTMFLFSGIAANLTRAADASRLTLLELREDKGGVNYARVLAAADAISRIGPGHLVHRMLGRLDVLDANITILERGIARELGGSHQGQQLGTLLAGYVTLVAGNRLSEKHVARIIDKYELRASPMRSDASDEASCLQTIMALPIRVDDLPRGGVTRSVARLLAVARGDVDPDAEGLTQALARRRLASIGLKLDEHDDRGSSVDLLVQNRNEALSRALVSGTATKFAGGSWKQYLSRIEGADSYDNRTIRCEGHVSKCIRVPLGDWRLEDE